MKLKCYEVKHYQCDVCRERRKHIDMHNDKICWDCNKLNKQLEVKEE